MITTVNKSYKIGILGGGQLGKMIAMSLQNAGHQVIVFSDQSNSPATLVTNNSIIASYDNNEALYKFVKKCDLVTLEFENIPISAIDFIENHIPCYPSSNVIRISQNRILEKRFLLKNKIPVGGFAVINSLNDLVKFSQQFEYNAILKTATMGYDGKGQFVITKDCDLSKLWLQVKDLALILERKINFQKEISIIIARNQLGEITYFDPIENIHQNGILDASYFPAEISIKTKNHAIEIANKIVNIFDLKGMIAIEFFVLATQEVLVNEIAPRPHNSGHITMDTHFFSQFDILSNILTKKNIKKNKSIAQGYMKNIIGNDINEIEDFSKDGLAKSYVYGKKEIKEGRKMAHINFVSKVK